MSFILYLFSRLYFSEGFQKNSENCDTTDGSEAKEEVEYSKLGYGTLWIWSGQKMVFVGSSRKVNKKILNKCLYNLHEINN